MCRIDSQFLYVSFIQNLYVQVFNSWNTLHLFLYIQLVFYSFTHFYLSITYVFRY